MNGETANLAIIMSLRDQASRGIQRIDKGFASLSKRTEKLRMHLGKVRDGLVKGVKVGAGVAAAGVAFLAVNVKAGIDSLSELEVLNKKTAQALKTTGKAAWISVDQIRDLSDSLEELTTVDDKVIQSGANLLLTFQDINRQAFGPALKTALDLSEALGKDLDGAVRLVGRALSDPVKGLTALTRVGVKFTDGEREKIKALVESGKQLEAQRIILRKLNRAFGGQAEAAANSYRGQMARLGDAVETLQQNLARALLPALTRVARKISGFLKADKVQSEVTKIGDALAGLFSDQYVPGEDQGSIKVIASPFTKGLRLVKEAFAEIQALPWDTIKGSLKTILSVGQEALRIFQGLPPEVQAGLITVLAANKVTGGALAGLGKMALDLALKAVSTIIAGNVTVVGKTVTTPGAPGNPGAPGAPRPPGGPPPARPGGVALPAIGAGIFMEQLDVARMQAEIMAEARNQGQLQTPVIRGVLANIQAVKDRAGVANQKHAQQTQISGTGNDLLRDLDRDQKKTDAAFQAEAARKAAADRRQHALQQLTINSGLRTLPILSGVRGAVLGVQQAVNRKDLSVTVRTSLSVSAREIASEVQRVTAGGGFVRS